LTITIPAGLRLRNLSEGWQSMVLAGVKGRLAGGNQYLAEPVIKLSDTVPTATYLLSAYCAEFHKANPSPNSQFMVEFADPTAGCILSSARAQGLSIAATQAAEWIHTDGITVDDLQSKFPVSLSDWSEASQVASQCQGSPIQSYPVQAQPVIPPTQYVPPAASALTESFGQSLNSPRAGLAEKAFYGWHETPWTTAEGGAHPGTLTVAM
jgi:hypothetical protein